jgi:hypothetical protein
MQPLVGCRLNSEDDPASMTGDRNGDASMAARLRRWGSGLFKLAAAFVGLVFLSEFLMSFYPCFALVVVDPFMCLLVVGLYQDQVGFFLEFRHYPALFILAVGTVAWWARREGRKAQ